MIDEHDIIERAVRLLEPEEPSLERMLRRRDRKHRNRRIAAAVVALAVFGSVVAAFSQLDRDRPVPVAPPSVPSQPLPFGASPQISEIVDLQGQRVSTISGFPPDASGFGLSADGWLISFVTTPPGSLTSRIAVVSSEGTGMRLLDTPGVFIQDAATTAPSPDGSEVAFEGVGPGLINPDIYVVGVDGSGLRRLTTDLGFDQFPRWSPDGSTIVYDNAGGVSGARVGGGPSISVGLPGPNLRVKVSEAAGDPAFYPSADIWSVPATGGEPTRLTRASGADTAPAFSPDGSRVAYSHDGRAWSMDADGSHQSPIFGIAPTCVRPSWSPDGDNIACIQFPREPSPHGPWVEVARADRMSGQLVFDLEIFHLDAETGASVSRTYLPNILIASTAMSPLWLPDGEHLLIRSVTPRS